MVSKIEKQFLMKEKECEGKERLQSINEIKNLEQSQIDFKILKSEIKKLLKENIELKKQLKESKKINFKESFKEISKSPVEIKGSLNHINRIIHQMELNKPYTITELKEFLLMNSSELRECIKIMDNCKSVTIEEKGEKFIRTS